MNALVLLLAMGGSAAAGFWGVWLLGRNRRPVAGKAESEAATQIPADRLASEPGEVEWHAESEKAEAERRVAAERAEAKRLEAKRLQAERLQAERLQAKAERAEAGSLAPEGARVAARPDPGYSSPAPTRSQPRQVACEIDWWRGYVKSDFVAWTHSPGGDELAIARSPAFRWREATSPPIRKDVTEAHEALVDRLLDQGWEAIEPGEEWYALRFRLPVRGGAEGQRPTSSSSERSN